jgi:hypothetical protein
MATKQEIEDAIITCVNEGIQLPEMKTWEEKEAWYENMLTIPDPKELGEEKPF